MRAVRISSAIILAGLSLTVARAYADDLVAAVLPLSRSPTVGQAGTAFATVINASGRALTGCTAASSNFNGTFGYQTTNPATNALTGTANTPFALAIGASQTMLISFQASSALAATNQPIIFQCTGSTAAASIIGVDTLLLSVNATAKADIVALAATASGDGIVKSATALAPAAFSVASVNVGAAAAITVTADTGDIVLPATITLCQTDPTSGVCTNPTTPASSVNVASFAANATPTFSIFVTPTAAIPNFPASTRLFVRFKETSGGATRGSTSVALNSNSTLAAGATPGGYYNGVYRVTSGPNLGQSAVANFVISETGILNGYAFDPNNANSISTIFNGPAISPTSALLYSTTGTIVNSNGNNVLTVNGAVSPRNLIAGLYSYTGETGEFYAKYNAGVYERASSLALVAGSWNVRTGGNVIGTATISSSGAMTGSAPSQAAGCTFTGTFGTINTTYNAYTVTFIPSSACGISGTYSGLTLLTDGNSANDSLPLALTASGLTSQVTLLLTKY
jgi:hypothetical protein